MFIDRVEHSYKEQTKVKNIYVSVLPTVFA